MLYDDFIKRYQFTTADKLGEGGYGEVFRAFDADRNKVVAIKRSRVTDDRFSLQREIELSHELTPHDNILRYINCYRFEGGLGIEMDYGTMEYVAGGNLSQVARTKKLSDSDFYDIVAGILKGLAHLHQEQCIHRDFKSANILMSQSNDSRWVPKISDFGLSRFTNQEATVSNSSTGLTYEFAAPEQILGQPVSHQTDLWAAGVTIYELFTHELPFQAAANITGEQKRVTIYNAVTNARLPARLNQIPEPYQTLIRECLVADRKKRAKSAEDLQAFLQNKSAFTPVIEPIIKPAPVELSTEIKKEPDVKKHSIKQSEQSTEKKSTEPQTIRKANNEQKTSKNKPRSSNNDISVEVSLSHQALLKGVEKQITVERFRRCGICDGKGTLRDSVCSACHGDGRNLKKDTFSLEIPAGKQFGDVVRFPGYGSYMGGTYSSLLIKLKLAEETSSVTTTSWVKPIFIIAILGLISWYYNTGETNQSTQTDNQSIQSDSLATGTNFYQSSQYDKALPIFKKLAQEGNDSAQFNLGSMYLEGQGVEQDYAQAVGWFRKAAEQGNANGQFNLGTIYEGGQGVDQNYAQAVSWYRKAADQGLAAAQINLGNLYKSGRGVEQDYTQAVGWFRKAADQGVTLGQYCLGVMYEDGQGVDQDYAQALILYNQAAEKGFAFAQNNIGDMYEHGKGVNKDISQAVSWYQKAARQGDTTSQISLNALGKSW